MEKQLKLNIQDFKKKWCQGKIFKGALGGPGGALRGSWGVPGSCRGPFWVPGADLEGATDRPLSPPPDLTLLASAEAPPEPLPAYPWLIAAALVLFLVERAWSLNWTRPTQDGGVS